MKLPLTILCFGTLTLFSANASGEMIAEINGNKFLSPYRDQDVSNVTGLITAKGPRGFWLRSIAPDGSQMTSESLYVYDNGAVSSNLVSGDIILVNGRVSEYRPSGNRVNLYLTELTRPTNIRVASRNNPVEPLLIGQDSLSPPTEEYTSLDNGDVYEVPNDSSQISTVNPDLQPDKYGLDFWESIMGELVTIRKPTAVSKPKRSFPLGTYNDTWVVGDWRTTGQNSRGGLTLTAGDGNPEAILIGKPLDGTTNPVDTKLGDALKDITGVVYQDWGTYRILPLTALSVVSSQEPALPEPATYSSDGTCSSLVVADYNIENFSPSSDGIEARAEHISTYLNSPDLIFLQEVQDDTGPTNNGVVSADRSLEVLVDAIATVGSVRYAYTDIDPINNQDGGQSGGNIRTAYLYNAEVLELVNPNPGSPTDATEVVDGPGLSFNPGRIDPDNSAWEASRKPLAAHWRIISDNSTFFTVNVHFASKGGSSPIEGDPRPPINADVDQRTQQANITAAFIAEILAEDSNAAVIMAGDCNEFTFVEPLKVLVAESGLVDLDEAAGVDPVERYTYLFDMNSQELDHFFVSNKIASQEPKLEHIHVNTWVSYQAQISDHDPSVAQLNVC